MSTLVWDRLLETCVRRTGDAIILADKPSFLRCETGLRALRVDPMGRSDLKALVESMSGRVAPPEQIATFTFVDLEYNGVRFRVTVVGLDSPQAVIVARLAANAEPLTGRGTGWETVPKRAFSLLEMLSYRVTEPAIDLILAGGHPPLAWAMDGIHVWAAPPLDDGDIAAGLSALPPYRSEERMVEKGYSTFEYYPYADVRYRVASFRESPKFVHFMKEVKNARSGEFGRAVSPLI